MGMGNLMIETSAPRMCFSTQDYKESSGERCSSPVSSEKEKNNNVKQLIMYYGSEWHDKFTCCRLKFGMYKNKTLQYILINDKSYLEWLHKNQNTINSLTDIDKNYINQIFICLNK
jgi:hypothetical protein